MSREVVLSGAWLGAVRHLIGMSGADLADHLGVNPRTVRAWEQGRDPINPGAAADIRVLLADHDRLVDAMLESPNVLVPRGSVAGFKRAWFVAAAARALEQEPGLRVEWASDSDGLDCIQ